MGFYETMRAQGRIDAAAKKQTGNAHLSTQDDLDDALRVLASIVHAANWDGKPHHLHRNMVIPEVLIEHARYILEANNWKQYLFAK